MSPSVLIHLLLFIVGVYAGMLLVTMFGLALPVIVGGLLLSLYTTFLCR